MAGYSTEKIQQMINNDLETSQRLLQLLKKETPSIKKRDYASIKQILLDKAPLLDQLKKHTEIRKEWLLSLYKVADENHWNTFLASLNIPDLERQWEDLHQNITECKAINDANGIMINRGKKTYSQLLHLLKGGGTQTTLYNEKGSHQVNAYNSYGASQYRNAVTKA